mgnify:CR=1 FL=1
MALPRKLKPSNGITVLSIVLAILFLFFISVITLGVITRNYAVGLEKAANEAYKQASKLKQWITVYAYNVSICKQLRLIYAAMKNESLPLEESDISGPTKILILNEGQEPVRIEYIAVKAVGSLVYEREMDVTIKPGEYLVYSPSELHLPSDYAALNKTLEAVVVYGNGEMFDNLFFRPPPPSVAWFDSGGGCHEP